VSEVFRIVLGQDGSPEDNYCCDGDKSPRVWAHLSLQVAIRRQSFTLENSFSTLVRVLYVASQYSIVSLQIFFFGMHWVLH